jgi:MFS family permease
MTCVAVFGRRLDLGRVAYIFAAYTATAILTRFFGAGLSDSFGRRRVILPTLVGLSASILLLANVHNVPMLICAGMLFGCSQGINYPTLHALVVDLSTEAHLGRTQALFNGAFNLGVTGSAFVFGLVAERFGYRPMFVLAALSPFAAAAVFYALGHPGAADTSHASEPLANAEAGP